jgi:enamine deaminase RidA (YjgF/YER057c/UK114 family)
MTLVGLTQSFDGGVATFQPNLAENLARGDENYLALLDAADAYIERNGLDLPQEPEARITFPDPECVTHPIPIWTWPRPASPRSSGPPVLPWITAGCKVDAFDANGKPQHQRGVSSEPGCISSVCRGSRDRFVVHLGRVARRQIRGRPDRHPALIPRLPRCGATAAAKPPVALKPRSVPKPFSVRSVKCPATHTRIRMFNTKETYPNQSLDNDLCQAVRAGNTVYVRGQVGTDFEGNLVGLGDPRAQAEQAMRNVKQLLEEAGSDLSHIVKTTTYLIDPRYREPVYQEVGKWLKGVFPISTGLVVSALGQPQWLMEIDVIAVIPE